MIKVEGHGDLVKDESSGAVLNIDRAQIAQARFRKKQWKEKEDELASIKNDISELKMMMKGLIERIDNA
jgi:hypothetical protein